ncbi:MAG: hypothetical protein WDM79_12035 [Terricaulis sp.]
MNIGDYQVIYDISTASYEWWPAVICFSLAAISLPWAFLPRRKNHLSKDGQAFASACIFLILGGLWVFKYALFLHAQDQKRSNDFSVVEGFVDDYQYAAFASHEPDHFIVAGHSFTVGPPMISVGYGRTSADGAPRLLNRCVRIEYTDRGAILWLGIAEPNDDFACTAPRGRALQR